MKNREGLVVIVDWILTIMIGDGDHSAYFESATLSKSPPSQTFDSQDTDALLKNTLFVTLVRTESNLCIRSYFFFLEPQFSNQDTAL